MRLCLHRVYSTIVTTKMNNPFRYGDLIARTSLATAEISLKYDIVISRVFVTREAYESRNSPFLMNVHKEQMAL